MSHDLCQEWGGLLNGDVRLVLILWKGVCGVGGGDSFALVLQGLAAFGGWFVLKKIVCLVAALLN
jgi:hypothetical protein